MLQGCYSSRCRSTIRLGLVALSLIASGAPPRLRAEEAKPSPTAPAKPSRAQLETQFKKADADRVGAREKTKERADAARDAMQIASDIAWLAFDAGKFDEAATWFAKSAELKEDSHVNARAYWEDYERTTAVEEDAKVDDHIKTGLSA